MVKSAQDCYILCGSVLSFMLHLTFTIPFEYIDEACALRLSSYMMSKRNSSNFFGPISVTSTSTAFLNSWIREA